MFASRTNAIAVVVAIVAGIGLILAFVLGIPWGGF
jgi:hypothetical protein